MNSIICITDGWGTKFGGINSFNYDFVGTLSRMYKDKFKIFCIEINNELNGIYSRKENEVNIVKLANTMDNSELVRHFYEKEIDKNGSVLWIGHDIITGRKSIECSNILKLREVDSKCAIIHHMDYESYYTVKESNGIKTKEKIREQEYILNNCDIIFSVGPKLKKSAISKLNKTDDTNKVFELIPGLANIEAMKKCPEEPFRGIAFGRLDRSTEIIKQSKLAIASFAKSIGENKEYFGNDPRLEVFGLEKNNIENEQAQIDKIAFKYAKRLININGYPYTENRNELFSKLRSVHFSMMLSFHEGFGLVGWEAISAGIPLIISQNSGLYEFIEARFGGKGVGCLYPIDIEGKPSSESSDGENFTESDLNKVVKEIEIINSRREKSKTNALDLKELLKEYTWERTISDFMKGCFTISNEDEIACSEEASTSENGFSENSIMKKNTEIKNDLDLYDNKENGINDSYSTKNNNKLNVKFNSERKNLSFLVVGNSHAGKSSFIRTFCNQDIAEILKITGEGQTTRFNGIYNFSIKPKEHANIRVGFYSKEEFVDKQCSKIIKKYKLEYRSVNSNDNLSDDIIKKDIDKYIKSEEKDEVWIKENEEKLKDLLNEDLISDEFFNFSELNLNDELGILLKEDDFVKIRNYTSFLNLLEGKLENVYDSAIGKIIFFIESYKLKYSGVDIKINQMSKENEKDIVDVQTIEFALVEDTSLILTCCIRNAEEYEIQQLENVEISSLSGMVKLINLDLELNETYAEICESVGIENIRLVDTYGLDHIPTENGDILIEAIKERLATILNEEFREVESVIFITPMIGNAAATDHRFQALIEAKRSVIPQIVYTKFDSYIEKSFKPKGIDEVSEDEFLKSISNFEKKNLNKIKGNFDRILKDYYSKDVAEYRKKIILENVSYFMGTYEIESFEKRLIANKNNIKYFLKILLSVLRTDNLGIDSEDFKDYDILNVLRQHLKQDNIGEKISGKLNEMLNKGQNELAKAYNCSHGNTKNAFWRRINCNMFGFKGVLNIRKILKDSFSLNLAKDAGIYKDSNIGNIIINEYITGKKLNIFIRECINKFSDYYFCIGCMPCNTFEFNQCDMSTACNNRGVRRVRRNDSCYQISIGSYSGSRSQGRYCLNDGISGIGLFDIKYGKSHECEKNCYWSHLFNKNNELSKGIYLYGYDITNEFIELFIEFCRYQLEKSFKATESLSVIKGHYCEIYN